MGRLVLNVLLSFAQFEREMISERTRDKMSAARKKGRWVGGKPLLGYNVVNSKLVVDPIEAARIQEVFDMYLKEKSTLAVAKIMREKGWRNKNWTTKKGREIGGQFFNKNTIGALLKNQTYVGKIEYDGETYPGLQEAIVDQGTFDRVHELLAANNRNDPATRRCKHGALTPEERAKAVNQIVEGIRYDGHTSELSITYHPTGIVLFNQQHQAKEAAIAC